MSPIFFPPGSEYYLAHGLYLLIFVELNTVLMIFKLVVYLQSSWLCLCLFVSLSGFVGTRVAKPDVSYRYHFGGKGPPPPWQHYESKYWCVHKNLQ